MAQSPSFQATSQTTLQMLAPGQALYVPVYQRTYTWGAEQVERLFEDIHAGINGVVTESGPPTFLGSTILFEGRSSVSPRVNTALPAQVLHVVDGQQRLTTLLLILGQANLRVNAAIDEVSQLATSNGQRWIGANLQMLASQLKSCLWVDLPSGVGIFKCLPRLICQTADVWGDNETNAKYESDIASYLHDLAQQMFDKMPAKSNAKRPHLRLVLDSIEEHLDRIVNGTEEGSALEHLRFTSDLSQLQRLLPSVPADEAIESGSAETELLEAIRVAVFAQFILGQVILIDVRAPDEATAFSLFEPLNTTGLPLTPIETLRPLAVSAEGGLESYLGTRSDAAFQRISRYVPDELQATERSRRVSSLLISFALGQDGAKLARNMPEQRHYLRTAYEEALYLESKRIFVEGIADTATFLSDVWEDPESPLITTGSPADRLRLEVLRTSKHSIVVPILVRYFERAEQFDTEQSRADFLQMVRAVTAFWTIWRSSQTTTSGIDSIYRRLIGSGLTATALSPLARSITPISDLPTAAEVKSALRNLLETRLAVTDGDSWSSKVNSQQVYETARELARYILMCAHDDAVSDVSNAGHLVRGAARTWPTLSLEVWQANYTVEHIAPQRKRSTDQSYSSDLYDEGEINRLGNLTLLPADLNGLLANKSWHFKREVFEMVSLTDHQERVTSLKEGGLYGLGARSKSLLESSDFIPFCKFVGEHRAEVFDRSYVRERGIRLAQLAWERLWKDLH